MLDFFSQTVSLHEKFEKKQQRSVVTGSGERVDYLLPPILIGGFLPGFVPLLFCILIPFACLPIFVIRVLSYAGSVLFCNAFAAVVSIFFRPESIMGLGSACGFHRLFSFM